MLPHAPATAVAPLAPRLVAQLLLLCCPTTPTQVIFRNVHKLLVDTASSEFLFCLDFWEDESVFKELFGPVVAVVEADLTTQLQVRTPSLRVLGGSQAM
jgi:hypothetical protein